MKSRYKTFTELYTDIIKNIVSKSGKSVDSVVDSLSKVEYDIKKEYNDTLIMDIEYYINKFIGR